MAKLDMKEIRRQNEDQNSRQKVCKSRYRERKVGNL